MIQYQRGNEVNVNSSQIQAGTNVFIADFGEERRNQHHYALMLGLPSPPNFKILLPAALPGTRCYTDASISPDNSLQVPRSAGLGIFIINGHEGAASTIYVKAIQKGCTSVLMSEVAALTLGAKILNALQVHHPFFLSDNQQLVSFFNGQNHSTPP